MTTLDWTLTRSEGVTLVELVVHSETTQQVRVESELSPVWPPRRQGVPLPGWDGATFEGTVEETEPLVVGYASPADPVEPPATLSGGAAEDGTVGPRTLVRALGDATPPRDAVFPDDVPPQDAGSTDEVPPSHETVTADRATNRVVEPAQAPPGDDPDPEPTASDGLGQFEWGPDRRQRSNDGEDSLEAVAQRLSRLERRLDAVEAAATHKE